MLMKKYLFENEVNTFGFKLAYIYIDAIRSIEFYSENILIQGGSMKTLVAMIVGGLIVLGLFLGVISSNNFVLNSETLLKSPKINVQKNLKESNSINNLNLEKSNNIKSSMNSNNSMSAFSELISKNGLLYGTVSDGANIIIPCSEGVIKNGELVVPEYYTSRPWEKFTDYIEADGNSNYTIYEYYKGKNTGVFKLKNPDGGLSGMFTHVSNNMKSTANFKEESSSDSGNLVRKPFYIGVIGQTAVTLTNCFNGTYTEYYNKDKHLFEVKKVNPSASSNYSIQLNEYYEKKLTGEYLLNDVGNDTYTGIFVAHPNTSKSITTTVGLTGSISPFSI